MAHEHAWVELRRQVPWTVDDFDPNQLAPERSRYEDGTPHTDEDHAAKVALPRPEVVVKCYGCDTVEALPVPAAAYTRVVDQLAAGQLVDGRYLPPGSAFPAEQTLGGMPLRRLLPEMREVFDRYGIESDGVTLFADVGGETLVVANLPGPDQSIEVPLDVDRKLRAAYGLPPRDDAEAAMLASAKKYEAEGRKASTGPAPPGGAAPSHPPVSPQTEDAAKKRGQK